MFNLKSDLKIYTCDKYNRVQKILKSAMAASDRYMFKGRATLTFVRSRYDNRENVQVLKFTPTDCEVGMFKEFLEHARIKLDNIESISEFHSWARANPGKTWLDFENGTDAIFSLEKQKLDEVFEKIRPDQLMNDLALSPNSKLAGLVGKGSESGYRRRMAKTDRQNQLLRLWALFGTETSMSAANKDLESILNGIVFHDFGITHCESMQTVLTHVAESIQGSMSEAELATAIKGLDNLIVSFGGKPVERSRPRSPFIRQIYDLIYQKAA